MSCDAGEVTERLENELSVTLPTSQLVLQPFCRFSYVTDHSLTLLSLYLRHSSFSNPSVALPMSQIILKPFRCFTYVTAHSPTLLSLLLRHWLFTYVTWRAAYGILAYISPQFVRKSALHKHYFNIGKIRVDRSPLMYISPVVSSSL